MSTTAYITYNGVIKAIELQANETWEEAKKRLKLSSGLWANSDFIFKGKALQNQDPVYIIPNCATLVIDLREQPRELTISAVSPTNKKYTLSVTLYDSMKSITKQLAEKLPGIAPDRLKLVATGSKHGALMEDNSWFGDYAIRDEGSIFFVLALRRGAEYMEHVGMSGKGPGRGSYITIPLLKKREVKLSDVAELNAKLAQFVRILEGDQAVEGEFVVHEEHDYHCIRWVPKDTLYPTIYNFFVSQGEGSEYLAAQGWVWGTLHDEDNPTRERHNEAVYTCTLEQLFSKETVRKGKISFKKPNAVHSVTDVRTKQTRPVVVVFNGPDSRTLLSVLKRHIAACFDGVAASEIVSLKVGDVELVHNADILALHEDDVISFESKRE